MVENQHEHSSTIKLSHTTITTSSNSTTLSFFSRDLIQMPEQKKTEPLSLQVGSAEWQEYIRQELQRELEAKVRAILKTPPIERLQKLREKIQQQKKDSKPNVMQFNDKLLIHWISSKEQQEKEEREQQQKQEGLHRNQQLMTKQRTLPSFTYNIPPLFQPFVKNQHSVTGYRRYFDAECNIPEPIMDRLYRNLEPPNTFRPVENFCKLQNEFGFKWPDSLGPLLPTVKFQNGTKHLSEPLSNYLAVPTQTIETQTTPYKSHTKWSRPIIVYDSERNSLYNCPLLSSEEYGPSLVFESRFESGNLRQARRVGQFEYELVLKSDLYTNRHTQWYFFRIENTVPGIAYKFRIVNLLKKDSLYNYGMRPLIYSEEEFKRNAVGWKRTGHHILYSRNITNLQCPLLTRGMPYYMLEWQMEFPYTNSQYYLAHCYPYTFTDLKDDLDDLITQPSTSPWIKREVLCETRAGNSCFLLTITDFDTSDEEKQAVVLSARVHPGESQSSWMMKGVLYFLTSPHVAAQELRKKFIFKIVPMLNPDGVIIGNYRCSLVGRDLNRNFRHPIKSSCPTVWYLKSMIEELGQNHQIMLYCDLHGHSRKHNVFMYGNNTCDNGNSGIASAKSFLSDRLFPWITALQAPDKFSFTSCKFRIRKCKESTGRVVMWRQLHIANSFTMEAAFSGSVLDRGQKPCHFSIGDYEDMGKSLCMAIYNFHKAQADERLQAKFTFSLTRQITQQLMKNNDTSNNKVPQLKDILRENQQNKAKNDLHSSKRHHSNNQNQNRGDEKDTTEGEIVDSTVSGMNYSGSGMDAASEDVLVMSQQRTTPIYGSDDKIQELLMDGNDPLDEATNNPLETMNGCLNLLLSLKATEALVESDSSSDSDSDTDSEIKPEVQKPPQRRRESRKKRSRCLPPSVKASSLKTAWTKESSKKKTNVSSAAAKKEQKVSKYLPQFVSKYDGRTNGGIPCYSKERSLERIAAKRLLRGKEHFDDKEQTGENSGSEYQNIVEGISFYSRYWTQVDIIPSKSHNVISKVSSISAKSFLNPTFQSQIRSCNGSPYCVRNSEEAATDHGLTSNNSKIHEVCPKFPPASCPLKPRHRSLEQLNHLQSGRLLRTNKVEPCGFKTISKPLRPP